MLETTLNILYVALGLGLVIFFHELGHFAVAKWCDVHVERFSIGFGPILWSRRKGETEYALSAIPFGGYVKMLGQDDMDPSQLTSEEIAQDPRAYSAKPVSRRMAIISAGVIMNIVTGLLFFATAFGMGVLEPSSEVGYVQVGKPAWEHGMRPGDDITRINDRRIETFRDITRAVALSKGPVTVEGVRRDPQTGGRKTFQVTLTPDSGGILRIIGVGPTRSLTLIEENKEGIEPTVTGTPAAAASPAFHYGDTLLKVENEEGGVVELRDFVHLQRLLADMREHRVVFHAQRVGSDQVVKIPVEPYRFRTLGLWMTIGKVEAVRKNSPADRAGIKPGDKIVAVEGTRIGQDINPLRLPGFFEREFEKKSTLELTIVRRNQADPQKVAVELRPDDIRVPAWLEKPDARGAPLSISSLGAAVDLIPTVIKVEPGSPAGNAGVKPNERVRKIRFFLPEDGPRDRWDDGDDTEFDLTKKDDSGRELNNWAYAFWLIQAYPLRHVELIVEDENQQIRTVTLEPAPGDDWYLPIRGIRTGPSLMEVRADDPLAAIALGYRHTRNTLVDVYLTIRNLLTADLPVRALSGPVKIAEIAYRVADQGVADLLLFLGFLSVNLAVLNFLPIPVLDGGHMVFLIWEAVTRKKPSEKVVIAATYFGLAFVLGLMGLVLYLDIFVNRI